MDQGGHSRTSHSSGSLEWHAVRQRRLTRLSHVGSTDVTGFTVIEHTLGSARPVFPPLSLGREGTIPLISTFERMEFFPKLWGGES